MTAERTFQTFAVGNAISVHGPKPIFISRQFFRFASQLKIHHNDKVLIGLPYRTFDKIRSVNRAEIVENKRLDATLEMVAVIQSQWVVKRSQAAPRRTGETGHMF